MTSTFDDLLLVIQKYGFEILTLSETWLRDNPYLLSHASIPGYASQFRNRDKIKGGGDGKILNLDIQTWNIFGLKLKVETNIATHC